jgi:hypothetical protein
LKLSQKPFCIGFPGAMKCQAGALSCAQASMAREVNSVPLSETIIPGLPRRSMRAVSSRATRRPEIDGSGIAARTFPGDVVDDIQDAEPSTVGELVMDEIQRPADVGATLSLRLETATISKFSSDFNAGIWPLGPAPSTDNTNSNLLSAHKWGENDALTPFK